MSKVYLSNEKMWNQTGNQKKRPGFSTCSKSLSILVFSKTILTTNTAQKMKFSIKDFFSKFGHIY